jgi:hypothetical protein
MKKTSGENESGFDVAKWRIGSILKRRKTELSC